MILKQLYYLREIDRFKSFSKAAVACNVSQPALSRGGFEKPLIDFSCA